MTLRDSAAARAELGGRLRRLAERAARAGGAVARAHFGRPAPVRLKRDRSEVTAADELAQRAVIECIRAARPADAFIAEERLHLSAPPPAGQRVCWAVDPIDGTRNYVRRLGLYACSVAALLEGFPIAGALFVPQQRRLISASRAEGLFDDGRPLGATPRGRPAGSSPRPVVAIPSSYPGGAEGAIVARWLGRAVVRNLGCTSLHLALVATGPFDAALVSDSRLWDIAAGWLFVELVGGRMTDLAGGALFPLDVAAYRGQPLPGVAARDPGVLERLRTG